MPFTPAHVIVTLPVAGRLRRASGAALAALVMGTMAPDAPMYLPLPWTREQTHSPTGVLTVTAAVALAAAVLWVFVVAPSLRVLAPTAVRQRLHPSARPRWWDLLLAYPMVAIGGFTHIAWDALTHADGYAVERVALLRRVVGQWPLYADLQFGSSLIGTAAVAVWVVVALARRVPDARIEPGVRWRSLAWVVVAGGTVIGAAIGRHAAPNLDVHHDLGVYLTTRAVTGALLCLGAVVVVTWAARLAGSWPAEPSSS